jgi:hypothetical protein
MYLPRIGPANRYDPAARAQQQRPQGLLGVTPSFQPTQVDQGLLQQGMTLLQSPQSQEADDGGLRQKMKQLLATMAGAPNGVPATPNAPPPATAASLSASTAAMDGTPAPGNTLGAFNQAVNQGINQSRFAPTPFQQQMERYPDGAPSQLAFKLGNAVRGGLDSLGIPDAVKSLQGNASSALDQTGIPDAMRGFRAGAGGPQQRQLPPEVANLLRQLGIR